MMEAASGSPECYYRFAILSAVCSFYFITGRKQLAYSILHYNAGLSIVL